jgi:hypothetical protein
MLNLPTKRETAGGDVQKAKKHSGQQPHGILDDPVNILLTEKEAAQFLKVSPRALQQRRYLSQPPEYLKLPGSSAVRYRLSVLMRYAADGEVPLP